MSAADRPLLRPELIDGLRAIVGERGLLTGEEVAMRSCDPFRDIPPGGGVIVRPASSDEVSRVMRLCHRQGCRVVPHGGRTGVAGGAIAGEEELVISLERMNRIEEVCAVTQTATVEAGVKIEALQDAAEEQGMFYPVDLGAKGTATLGGTIATNAGGNRVLRWGMTRANLLGLEAVLADGTIVDAMNRLVKNNVGYDVKHFFVGSEGTLGIVTRAVVRLVPAPCSQNVAIVAVPDNDRLLRLLAAVRRFNTLSAFEVMWPDYYDLVANSDTNRRPLEPGQGIYVLVESMGYDEELDRKLFEGLLEKVYAQDIVCDAVLASSGQQVADLWHVREGSECIAAAMTPFISFDISLDVRKVEAFIHDAKAQLGKTYPELATVTFGHLGDNNIHLGVHVGPDTIAEEPRIERQIYGLVHEYGGALTAEHGIGQFKKDFLPKHKHPGEMEVMRRIRSALDPEGLLNRDVLFPTGRKG